MTPDDFKLNKLAKNIASACVLAALTACGGGGDGDSSSSEDTTTSTAGPSAPVTAAGSYLQNAKVCFDINGNERCDVDDGDIQLTDRFGNASILIPEDITGKTYPFIVESTPTTLEWVSKDNADGVIVDNSGSIDLTGTTVSRPFIFIASAPDSYDEDNPVIVSAISTELERRYQNAGATSPADKDAVKQSFATELGIEVTRLTEDFNDDTDDLVKDRVEAAFMTIADALPAQLTEATAPEAGTAFDDDAAKARLSTLKVTLGSSTLTLSDIEALFETEINDELSEPSTQALIAKNKAEKSPEDTELAEAAAAAEAAAKAKVEAKIALFNNVFNEGFVEVDSSENYEDVDSDYVLETSTLTDGLFTVSYKDADGNPLTEPSDIRLSSDGWKVVTEFQATLVEFDKKGNAIFKEDGGFSALLSIAEVDLNEQYVYWDENTYDAPVFYSSENKPSDPGNGLFNLGQFTTDAVAYPLTQTTTTPDYYIGNWTGDSDTCWNGSTNVPASTFNDNCNVALDSQGSGAVSLDELFGSNGLTIAQNAYFKLRLLGGVSDTSGTLEITLLDYNPSNPPSTAVSGGKWTKIEVNGETIIVLDTLPVTIREWAAGEKGLTVQNGFVRIVNIDKAGEVETFSGYNEAAISQLSQLISEFDTSQLDNDSDTGSTNEQTQLVAEGSGNDRDALVSPNGSESWTSGNIETISWLTQYITGSTVDLYVLQDDPTGLFDKTNQNIGSVINSKNWFKFASSITNTGSYDLDPSDLNASGDAFMVLVVSTEDNSKFDISDSTFSVNLDD